MSDEKKPTLPSAGSGANAPPNNPVGTCNCTVTLSPKDVKLCGAGKTADVTASSTPSGGTYSFSSSDTGVATVAGSSNKGTITGVKQGTATIKVTCTVPGCTPCTDTATVKVCTCSPKSGGGRYYAYASKSDTNITAGKATIKTHYGKLCCEHLGCTDLAKNNAYVNVLGAGRTWAQTGYRRIRNAGSSTYTKMRYTEMNGAVYKRKDDTPGAPAEGSSHEYRVELDASAGTWTFYYDGTAWSTFTDTGWQNTGGTTVQYPGELINKEDDMPGTSGDKCSFTDCQYRTGTNSYVDAGFTAANLHTDDSAEWGIELVSVTAFNIWDKNPNP